MAAYDFSPFYRSTVGFDRLFNRLDALVGQDGKPAKCNPVHYVGRFRRDGALIVSIPGQRDSRLVLQRVRHPKPREVEELACAGTHC